LLLGGFASVLAGDQVNGIESLTGVALHRYGPASEEIRQIGLP